MKILWGYGNCRFQIRVDGSTKFIELKIDSNTYPVDTRVGYSYSNIYSNKVDVVEKIVRSFSIRIIRNDSTQDDILSLLYYLKRNDFDYVYFQLHKCAQDVNGIYMHNIVSYRCVISEPVFNNFISDFQGGGNVISLSLTTQYSIPINYEKIINIPYRDTTTGLWGIYPDGTRSYIFSKTINSIGTIPIV